MRLIDADALTEYLKCLFPARGMWEIEGDTAKDAICETVVEAMEMVKNMETIKPKRKRGRWIIKENPETGWYSVTCSECGEDVTSTAPCIGFYPNAKVTWDYCPNCGADMREVDDERLIYTRNNSRDV